MTRQRNIAQVVAVGLQRAAGDGALRTAVEHRRIASKSTDAKNFSGGPLTPGRRREQTGYMPEREVLMKRVAVLLLSILASSLAYGQVLTAFSVPSLDEGGLIALIALVSVVGGVLARRRKK